MIDHKYIIGISFILPFLYAETHYRFKYFFSWLRKSEPEIIADIPSRITKGEQLPVLIMVKDADKYPVQILTISVYNENNLIFSEKLELHLSESYFEKILFINTNKITTGDHNFDIQIKYKIKNKVEICYNDNHRGTSHKPLPIHISSSPLPQIENCIYGETHCHTNYTSDQLEFGASIKGTSMLAKALGLKFFCATDHSYDLDDDVDNYLINDPQLKKWQSFRAEVNSFNNENNDFYVIPGEEVSLSNSRNKNVHCLLYNSEKFYPGAGDSGEKWLHPYSELSIQQVLEDIENEALVFAAHPVEPVPFLQRFLIRRDNWHEEDCKNTRLNGLQFANGGPEKYFNKGKQLWIKLLLQGQKLIGLAGNDAHGNFARYRQVSFPFVIMKENYFNLFGVWRTAVYLESWNFKMESILHSLRLGNCFLTNGPALQFKALSKNKWLPMGSTCERIEKIIIIAKSSEEFGYLEKVTVFIGIIGDKEESVLYENKFTKESYEFNIEQAAIDLTGSGYIRAKIITNLGKIALSNPIWF